MTIVTPMARLRVEFEFMLDVDIWLTRDCLGRSVWFTKEQRDVELRLPPFGDIDPSAITLHNLNFIGYAGQAEGHCECEYPLRIAVDRFKLIFREEVAGISRAALDGPSADTIRELITIHQQERLKWAERLSIDFLDRLRARGQTWLGPTGTISFSMMPNVTTYDGETQFRFPFGNGGTFVVPARPRTADLDLRSLEQLTGPLATDTALPLPETFLADAAHFSSGASDNDFRRAVLLAAIACELKVKSILRGKVFPRGLPLVETLISNPRDFSMSAAGLFDKAMKAALGRSLKEDNRGLYKAIDGEKGLFFLRNKIAHTGMSVTQNEADHCVDSARQVFAWLDSLPVAADAPQCTS